jgi:competence protein ComEC
VSDRWVLVLAAATAAGASAAVSVPLGVAVALLALALASRRPLLVCLGAMLLASTLGHRAEAGLAGGPERDVVAEVQLVTDPRPSGRGLRAEARLGPQRVLLQARGTVAGDLAPRLAGEHVGIAGRLTPIGRSAWTRSRHLVAQVQVWRIESWRPGAPAFRLANGLRRTLERGAHPLTDEQRSLYTGLVVGDDRHQSPGLADDFRGAGLTHLVAVSGQNVAFVLAIAAPVSRRLRLWPRLFLALAVIGLFGLVTRFEPSVLRASAVAALSVTASTIGRPVGRLRILGLAVTALLLVDPLLVSAVGFQLSVAAAGGILVLAGPLARVLPGPALVREPLAVTVAAQLGVAPVLIATFGPMPLAALPANLLAVPAAGAVMVWGMTAGLVAGVVGGPVAEILHVPTRALLDWLAWVARRAASLPLGELGAPGATVGGAGVVFAVAHRTRVVGRLGGCAALLVLVAAVVHAAAPAPLRESPDPGLVVWRAGGSTALVLSASGATAPPGPTDVLELVRRSGVRRVDLVVVADRRVEPATVEAVARRYGDPTVLVPPGHDAHAAIRVPRGGTRVVVGGLALDLIDVGDRIVVDGRPAPWPSLGEAVDEGGRGPGRALVVPEPHEP